MNHGFYISEFESELARRGFAISQHSLSELVARIDFAKLSQFPPPDRSAFYQAMADSIPQQSRGVENGVQILGEDDADRIVRTMATRAQAHAFAASRIRDIWCRIFIGGCP